MKKSKLSTTFFIETGENLNKKFQGQNPYLQDSDKIPNTVTKFRFEFISEKAVTKAIMRLKSTKSAGLDQIPNNLLKIAAPIISRSLAKIFNISSKAGVFPADWKLACVAPIFKNGSKSELGNYRPISMLYAVARVFERLIYEQLSEYFQENNFLTNINQVLESFTQELRQC